MADGEDTLDTVLNKATNPANHEEDWEYIMIFCDKVNKDPEGPTVAVRLLAHKLQSPQEREALFALSTLEACVKNCGRRFHSEIGKFRFLNEIIKVVSPKYLGTRTSEKVKKRCIELMYSWSKGLSHENKINEAYAMLKTQGIVKEDPLYIDKTLNSNPMPPPPRPKNALFEDDEKAKLLSRLLKSKNPEDLQAANRLIKNMVQQDADRMDKISKRMSELETINNNVSVLSEMLEHYSSESATQSDTDTMKELYETLEKLRPNLFRLASDTDERDNDGISDILRANDDVMKVMNQYKMKVDGSSDVNHSLLDLSFDQSTNSPSKQAPLNNESGVGASILDEQLLALGLSDTSDVKPVSAPSMTSMNPEGSTTLEQLSDIFASATTFANVAPSSTLLPTSGSQPPAYNIGSTNAMASMVIPSSTTVFTGLTQTMSSTTNSGLLMSGSMVKPQVFSSPISSSGHAIPPLSADSLASKSHHTSTNATCQNAITDSQKKAMEELDILGQTLMQQSLSKDKANLVAATSSSSPPPPVVSSTQTTSATSTITADSTFTDLFNGTTAPTTVGSVGSILSLSPTPLMPTSQESCADTLSIGSDSPTILPKELISLSDVFVPLDTVEPGTLPSLNAYDKEGLKIIFHFAKNKPRPDVLVMVVSVMSTNLFPVKSFLFQAAVPKVMKVKLQPPSATDLPTYNPILPPAAITQVMLIANPQKEKIRLKFKITYVKNSDTVSDVGEIDDFATN